MCCDRYMTGLLRNIRSPLHKNTTSDQCETKIL